MGKTVWGKGWDGRKGCVLMGKRIKCCRISDDGTVLLGGERCDGCEGKSE